MYESQLVTGLAAAFAAMSAVLGVLGLLTNLLVLVPAVLFAAVAYFMWYHASGRLAERIYAGVEAQATTGPRQRAARDGGRGGFGAGPRADWEPPGAEQRQRWARQARRQARDHARQRRAGRSAGEDAAPTRREAASVLGVDPGADADAVRTAYRERIKETHPDTGGDEDEFKRVRDAYERLSE